MNLNFLLSRAPDVRVFNALHAPAAGSGLVWTPGAPGKYLVRLITTNQTAEANFVYIQSNLAGDANFGIKQQALAYPVNDYLTWAFPNHADVVGGAQWFALALNAGTVDYYWELNAWFINP